MNSYVCASCSKTVECCTAYFRVLHKKNPDLICKLCRHRGKLEEHNAKYHVTEHGRDCKTCGSNLPWSMFPGNGLTKGRSKNPNCKDCINSSFKTRWGKDTEFTQKARRASRVSHLKRTYGITIAEYERMFEEQKGRCKICHSGEDLCVDHCHQTGKIRGLLCRDCNKALGIFKDSPTLLWSAVEYLIEKAI